MENDEYLALFLSEAEELLTTLNHGLITLEKNPADKHALDETFRCFHTLKGNSAAMGIPRIEKLAHALEHILQQLRTNERPFTSKVAKSLFQGLDLLAALLDDVQHKSDKSIDEESFITELAQLPLASTEEISNEPAPSEDANIPSGNKLKSVRIDLERLDSLMNTVGQLHICKLQLSELSKQRNDSVLAKAMNEMERTVNQLQTKVMQMRLLPLQYLFNNFPRLVRDDAQKEGKEVAISISGGEIGLDRTILDEINDPMIHILRNAVSHGIESPEERKRLGKSAQGHIRVHAYQEKNRVFVTIKDDGCGIDAEKIRHKLYEKGLMTADSLEKLTAEELFTFITLPDFSLKEEVTERAGRGIGMNVVKTKVESIGGSFEIHSESGKGTTFILQLPLSMAITKALLVGIFEEIYAIPLYNIIETIKIDATLIRQVHGQEMVPYRDGVLPLVRIKDKWNVITQQQDEDKRLCVVVCELNHQKMGFIVDAFAGQQEIVIKNLTGAMQQVKGYTGATILGNGRVAMILDLAALVN